MQIGGCKINGLDSYDGALVTPSGRCSCEQEDQEEEEEEELPTGVSIQKGSRNKQALPLTT